LIEKKAIFRGDSEIDQIFKIFQVLGTPTKDGWSHCSQLPHFKASFPKFKKEDLTKVLKNIDS
jgi:hypothetical protein